MKTLTAALFLLFVSTVSAVPVRLERRVETTVGTSVFVLGDIPALGGDDVRKALKLSPTTWPDWFVTLDLPAGTTFRYRFLTRADAATEIGNASNATFLDAQPLEMTVPGAAPPRRSGVLHYLSGATAPVLEIRQPDSGYRRVPLARAGAGRSEAESLWAVPVEDLPAAEDWQFRIDLGGGSLDRAAGGQDYRTPLAVLWLQDGQIYNYSPPATVSAPRVVKVPNFQGTLSARNLYIYVPRGYAENTDKRYPVLYMHDGQAAFQAYPENGFGTWAADTMATRLIAQGRMRECVIVAVANSSNRLTEYLPPYDSLILFAGTADQTTSYYRGSVASYVAANYRVLTGRDDTATCGSSMGGFLSTYMAWEFPAFARHHAALSPAYWITRTASGVQDNDVFDRLRTGSPRDVRIYLDSGTQDGNPRGSISTIPDDDGMPEAWRARDELLQNGYRLGPDFRHEVFIGAIHSESSWAARLEQPFLFLFPITQEPEATPVAWVPSGWRVY